MTTTTTTTTTLFVPKVELNLQNKQNENEDDHMAAQNNQHRLMKNWAAILTISSVLIVRVRYLRLR